MRYNPSQNGCHTEVLKPSLTCVYFSYILEHIHDCTECRVDGSKFALKFGTMNKLRLFISWTSIRMKDSTFELYAEHRLALTREQFHNFRQEDMIRMTSGPTSPPMTTFTGHPKETTASESQVALNNFKKGTKRDES